MQFSHAGGAAYSWKRSISPGYACVVAILHSEEKIAIVDSSEGTCLCWSVVRADVLTGCGRVGGGCDDATSWAAV